MIGADLCAEGESGGGKGRGRGNGRQKGDKLEGKSIKLKGPLFPSVDLIGSNHFGDYFGETKI